MQIGSNQPFFGHGCLIPGQCDKFIPVGAAIGHSLLGVASNGLWAIRSLSAQKPQARILAKDQEITPQIDTA